MSSTEVHVRTALPDRALEVADKLGIAAHQVAAVMLSGDITRMYVSRSDAPTLRTVAARCDMAGVWHTSCNCPARGRCWHRSELAGEIASLTKMARDGARGAVEAGDVFACVPRGPHNPHRVRVLEPAFHAAKAPGVWSKVEVLAPADMAGRVTTLQYGALAARDEWAREATA